MAWSYETDFDNPGLKAQSGIEDLIFVRNGTLVTLEEQFGGGISVDPSGKGTVKPDAPNVLSDEKPGLLIRLSAPVSQIAVRVAPIGGGAFSVFYGMFYPSRYGAGYIHEAPMPGEGLEYSYSYSPNRIVLVRIVNAGVDFMRLDVY